MIVEDLPDILLETSDSLHPQAIANILNILYSINQTSL